MLPLFPTCILQSLLGPARDWQPMPRVQIVGWRSVGTGCWLGIWGNGQSCCGWASRPTSQDSSIFLSLFRQSSPASSSPSSVNPQSRHPLWVPFLHSLINSVSTKVLASYLSSQKDVNAFQKETIKVEKQAVRLPVG